MNGILAHAVQELPQAFNVEIAEFYGYVALQ
jgi:hypothetical protein